MFENVGEKIMRLAIISTVLAIILASLAAVFFLFGVFGLGSTEYIVGLGIAIAGGFICVVSLWLLYAFGQLVDDVHKIAEK